MVREFLMKTNINTKANFWSIYFQKDLRRPPPGLKRRASFHPPASLKIIALKTRTPLKQWLRWKDMAGKVSEDCQIDCIGAYLYDIEHNII